jgi:hypothetical protein
MFSTLNKIRINGTNSQLLQKVVTLILFGVSLIKYGQKQVKTHYNFREKSFIKFFKFPLDFLSLSLKTQFVD